VVVCYLDEATQSEAQAVANACEATGAPVLLMALDVTQDGDCQRVAQATLARFGRIDALINCAGTTRFIPHADLDALDSAEFHRTYDVNVVGAHQMIKACAPALKTSGAGAVVNISSIGGVIGRGSSVAYAASKGALNTLTIALARALAPQVRVNAIAPGFVVGGLPSRVLAAEQHEAVLAAQLASSPLRRASEASEVAALAWFLCALAPAITGEVVMMDNGLHLNAG
jgi:NAD(P)-dependent dehydrogenase (short-subunit alcohol dehydrogenase family)